VPNFVITYLGPDMAAGEITATLIVYLSGVLLTLHLWPRPRRRARVTAGSMQRRRALLASVRNGWAT
jgi:hypothetical protein